MIFKIEHYERKNPVYKDINSENISIKSYEGIKPEEKKSYFKTERLDNFNDKK
jgi:hypothetical protein